MLPNEHNDGFGEHGRAEQDVETKGGKQTERMHQGTRETPGQTGETLPECTAVTKRYQMCQELARGGMGVVLRCFDNLLHREVAVKVLLSRYRDCRAERKRFVREARVLSQLQHPGIVPIYDMGDAEDGRPFFTMQLIEGRSLEDLLRSRVNLQSDLGRQLSILAQVSHALAYAHEQGVVHLDLKPSNIMLGSFGAVQLMDWGLSRVILGGPIDKRLQAADSNPRPDTPLHKLIQKNSPRATISDESVQGTPAYMSPEQARGEALDVRADVFGLGAILCQILTGRPPYEGKKLGEVHKKAALASLDEALRGLDSCVERPMVRLAKVCLSPNREQRPRDAGDVAKILDGYVEEALQTAESDLREFFDLSLDLFCIANTSGYFVRVNENFPKVLGYDAKELVVRPFLDFVHPEDKQSTIDAMSALSAGEPVIRFRNRYRTSSGKYLLLEWTSKSIPEKRVIYAVARDVSAD